MDRNRWDDLCVRSTWQDSAVHQTQFGSGQAMECFTDVAEGSQATETYAHLSPQSPEGFSTYFWASTP